MDDAIARQALHDLTRAYARGVDGIDEALLASVFHPDAEIVSGVVDGTAAEFARDICAMVRTNLDGTVHTMIAERFEIDGDAAKGEIAVLAEMTAGGQETVVGGRYLDRYERRDGVWKIAHRRFVQDRTLTDPSAAERDDLRERLETGGGHASNDPAVAFWAAA